MNRLREALECFKRALLGTDNNEVTIDLKIAKLHHDLEQYTEAASYHRRIIDLSLASCAYDSIFCGYRAHHIYITQ